MKKTKNSHTEAEAAEHIGMSQSFLSHHRQNGFIKGRAQGPAYIRIGKTIRYLRKDLDEWLNERRRAPRDY